MQPDITKPQSGPARPYSRRAFLRSVAYGSGAYAALALTACQPPGNQPAASNTPTGAAANGQAPSNSEPVTLRVWGYGLDDARAQARVTEFQNANANVALEPVGGELNTQQLLTAVASGDPPEVVNVDRSEVGSWAGRGAIDPLDDLITRDQFDMNQFYPVVVEQVTYQDQIYGVPQFVNVDLFFMNGDVLQAAGVDPATVDPGNWEQLQELGEQLHQMEGQQVVRTGFDTKVQDGRLWLWSWANGVELISADGTQLNFTDPRVIEALIWAKETVDRQGGELARAAFSQAQNFFSPQNPVLIGQIAMTIFEQWLIGVMKVNPQANFVTLLPRMRNSTDELTNATGAAFAIPRGVAGDRREVAWNFIKGMTSTAAWLAGERATKVNNQAENTPYHPTITGNRAADQEAWTQIYEGISPSYDQAVALFPRALEVARSRYAGPVAAQINELMTANVNDALQGAKTPEQAMADLQTQAQQAIQEFAAQQ